MEQAIDQRDIALRRSRQAYSLGIIRDNMSLNYYIADTETTGLMIDVHEINQISVMRVSDREQLSLQIKVKHPHVYNPQALEIQGITPDDLKKGVPIEEAVDSVEAFLKEDGATPAARCIVAHNAPFDRKFIHRAWDTCNKEFPADLWLCTQSFAKRHVQKYRNGTKIAEQQVKSGVEIKRDKYGDLKPKFGLNNFMMGIGLTPKVGAHSAEVDVQNTIELYHWLMNSKTEHVSLITRVPHKEVIVPEVLDIDDI
jgi:DNA polymerase III epsilon subunit-like protein